MKKLFVIALVIFLLGLSMNAYAGATKDVNVVNTPDVNVVNQPTVNSAQSGLWGVNITNDTSNPIPVDGVVEIVNPDPIPVITDNFPREPFFKSGSVSISDGSYGDLSVIFLGDDIPAGNILVVESFSWKSLMRGTDIVTEMTIQILPEFGTSRFLYPHITQFRSDGQFNRSQNYQLMRLYLQSGTALRVRANRNGNVGDAGVSVTVTGYLIPDDSPSLAP